MCSDLDWYVRFDGWDRNWIDLCIACKWIEDLPRYRSAERETGCDRQAYQVANYLHGHPSSHLPRFGCSSPLLGYLYASYRARNQLHLCRH